MNTSFANTVATHPWVRALAVSVFATLAIVSIARAAVTLNANIDTDGTLTADGLITGTNGATVTGAAVNLNASSNFATNINTGTSTGALTLGGGSGTVEINSSNWDISTSGSMTGIGAITMVGDVVMNHALANFRKSSQATITADAAGLQGGSPVTADLVEVSTSAGAGDSITLPAAIAGQSIIIINHGANSIDVYPASGDAIDEAAVNTARALAPNATLTCHAWNPTNWECAKTTR